MGGGDDKKTPLAAFKAKLGGKKNPPTLVSVVPANASFAQLLRETNFTQTAMLAKQPQAGTGIVKDEVSDMYENLELVVWDKDRGKIYKSHNFCRVFFSPDRMRDIAVSVNVPEEQLEDRLDMVRQIFDSVQLNPRQDEQSYLPEGDIAPT